MDKLCLKQAVIVEGKYDKIRLEALIDGVILTTDGFRVFKDKEMQRLIRELANTCGIAVLTDSDAAGFRIRAMLSNIAGGEIINVYIPDILGKERRKRIASAEGKLGVEGMETETLREAFSRAGISFDGQKAPDIEAVTLLDLYDDGLCGGQNSAELRRELYGRLGLPARLSTKAALPLLNRMITRGEYKKLVAELRAL